VFRHWFYTCFYFAGSRRAKAVQEFEEEERSSLELYLSADETWMMIKHFKLDS